MKIKKIKPTPRSITQRNPTKMSPSAVNKSKPNKTRYIPARYQRTIKLSAAVKRNVVKTKKTWIKSISVIKRSRLV